MEYLILAGSNLNDPPARLAEVVQHLQKAGLPPLRSSALYRSAAWGYQSPHEFFNQAHILSSPQSPLHIFNVLMDIERRMGRQRSQEKGYTDRIIDLDILLAGQLVVNSDILVIPHPRMHLRRFALTPAAELAGSWIHPIYQLSVQELLNRCPDDAPVTTFTRT
ncbi:MAG: 2-amino-4-hydroxy-6-hydroxymethyldihydropteridine diphosphokinase [Flavobacteriales bacterium]|nr:2-amino-4-hydroxy-6-hydroxymethyldihydropteridine diphosphokinase [Flavobacteriales bacterium]MCX7649129.1 2-amino-4-hydroxy-6-hydroxymethyldihydropteridine diphosphokinase [Flavobacteriales bacterium]MDW8410534.1 2-amino-4-hydroxy-6-hydroxymethyldihydropteridine diphosphokinase [Flavobacteriales bacterium]